MGLLSAGAALGQQAPAEFPHAIVQAQAGGRIIGVDRADRAPAAAAVNAAQADSEDAPLRPGGTVLETNSDVESLLDQAVQYLAEAQYRRGIVLAQHVVDKYGSVLTSPDNRLFIPVRTRVRRMISQLGPEGLSVYRLSADGEARGLLGGADPLAVRDPEALREVVDRFFISSLGDEAAYALANLLLDQHDYYGARRLLRMVLTEHPDPSIQRADLLIRLVVASARLGDVADARQHLAMLNQLPMPRKALALAESQIGLTRPRPQSPTDGWRMRFGGVAGDGAMAGMGDAAAGDGKPHLWAEAWDYRHDLMAPPQLAGSVRISSSSHKPSRPQMVERWKKGQWLPTGQVVFEGHRMAFKTHHELICVDRRTGKLLWKRVEDKEASGHVSVTHYSSSSLSSRSMPASTEEASLFGDPIGRSLSIIDGVIYQIEHHDPVIELSASRRTSLMQRRMAMHHSGSQSQALSGSALVAIDLATGKVKWRAGRTTRAGDPLKDVQFLGAPIGVAGKVIVPVLREGEVLAVALDQATGAVAWQTFVWAPPMSEIFTPRPIGMAAGNGELYLAGGFGVLSALDVHRGETLWAVRYERDLVKPSGSHSSWMAPPGSTPRGWRENAVFCAGGLVLVLPTDAERVLAFDRSTGQLAYRVKIDKPQYAVGMASGGLFIAGGDLLARYATATGKLVWQAPVGAVHGRAALTQDAIYQPQGETVVRLDIAGGKRLAETAAMTPRGDPLGNLISDGRRLYGTGMEYIYALQDSQGLLADLGRRIAQSPDTGAYLARAKVHGQIGQGQAMLADLRLAVDVEGAAELKAQARQALIHGLLAGVRDNGSDADALLGEAGQVAETRGQKLAVQMARADRLVAKGQTVEAVEAYLTLAGSEHAELVPIEPACSASVSLAAKTKLEQLVEQEAATAGPLVEARAQTEREAARQTESAGQQYAGLVRVAEVYGATLAGRMAVVEAAGVAMEAGQFERTEVMLERRANTASRAIAGAAWLGLGELYASRQWSAEARDAWQQVVERYAEVPMSVQTQPAAKAATAAETEAEAEPVTITVTAGQMAAQKLAEMTVEAPPGEPLAGVGGPPWKQLWRYQGYGYAALPPVDDAPAPRFLRENLIIASQHSRSRLICRNLKGSKVLWEAPIPSQTVQLLMYAAHDNGQPQLAHFDGHLLVMPIGKKLVGLSLITGKRIWEQELDDAEAGSGDITEQLRYRSNTQGYLTGLSLLAVGHGVVGRVVQGPEMEQYVEARDAATGQVMWRREFADGVVDGLRVAAGWVCIVSHDGTKLTVADARTGAEVSQAKLENRRATNRMLWTADRLIYQDNSSRIIRCIELADGSEAWQVNPEGYSRLGRLNERLCYLAQSSSSGHLRIVDLDSGKVIAKFDRNVTGRNVQDAALAADGKSLYAIGYNNKSEHELRLINLDTKKVEKTVNFGRVYSQRTSAQTLVNAGGHMPWVERRRNENGSYSGGMEVAMYDLATGKKEAKQKLPMNGRSSHYVQYPPTVVGHVLLVSTNNGLMAFAHDSDPAATAEDAAEKPAENSGIRVVEKDGVRIIIGQRDTPFRDIVQQVQKAHRDGVKVQVQIDKGE
jgi:outer membrane protein assembly factor BamB